MLSYFKKYLFYKSSIIQDNSKKHLLELLKDIELIDENNSIKYLIENKQELNKMILDCNFSYNMILFQKYMLGNIKNYNNYDVDILIKYGKYQLFKQIFYCNNNLELNELNYKKYKKIFESLNLFYEKCKKIEKDSLQLAKLYNAACNVILEYLVNLDER